MKSIFYFIGLSILMACYSYSGWSKEIHDHQERQEIALSASEAQRMLEQARKDNIALVEQNLELKKSYQTLQAIMKRQAEIIDYLLNLASLTPYHIQPSKESKNSIISSSTSKLFKFLPSSQKHFRETKIEGFSSLLSDVQKDKFLDMQISPSVTVKTVPLGLKASLLDFQGTPNPLMSKLKFSSQPSLGALQETTSHYLSSSSQEIEGGLPKKSYEEQEFTPRRDDLNEQSTNLHRNLNVQDEHVSKQQELPQEENTSLPITELEQTKSSHKGFTKEIDEEKQAYKNLQKRLQASNRQNFNLFQANNLLKDENQTLLTQIDSKLAIIKKQEAQVSILQMKLSSRVKEQEILETQLHHYASTIKSFYETIHALTKYLEGGRMGNDLEQISTQRTRDQYLSLEDINDYLNVFSSTAGSIAPFTAKKTDEDDGQPLP